MCPPRTNSSNPGCRRRPSLPYSDRLGGEKAISCQINSSQVKSSQVKTLPVFSSVQFSSVKSIKLSQISTTDRTHARTGPETQRAQAHNHTQNSNQVCMSLRSAVEAPTCISLNEYMYVPRFLTPNPPDSVEVCRSGVRADAGSDVSLLVGTSLGARRGRSGAAGAGAGLDSRASLDHAPRSSSGTRCTGTGTDARADGRAWTVTLTFEL